MLTASLKRTAHRDETIPRGSGASIERFGNFRLKRLLSVLSVTLILVSIGASTTIALEQIEEQGAALEALQSSGQLKQDLDLLQWKLLDAQSDLQTVTSTKAFYRRLEYAFPLQDLMVLTEDARVMCDLRAACVSQLDGLDGMLRFLAQRCNELGMIAMSEPGAVRLGDRIISEIDTYFYTVLTRLAQSRMQADAAIGTVASKSSTDAKSACAILLGCGLVASILLLAVICRNACIARKLRVALGLVDRARDRCQRFFDEHPLPVWLFDRTSRGVLAANRAAQRKFGYTEDGLPQMSLGDICLEGELAETRHQTDDDKITRSRGVLLYTTKTGESLSMEVQHFDLEDNGYPATLSVMVDGTHRERDLCKGRRSEIQAGAHRIE